MKKILLITLLLVSTLYTFAQQDPQYSLYMFNPLGVNPGYAGSREVLSAVLVHRTQWIGLDGAPETQVFSINTPFKNKKMGAGIQIVNDEIGAHTTQTLKATYAYRLKLGAGKLAFGLSGGILNYNYDWAKIEYKETEDLLPETSPESFIIPTFDFGIYYNTKTLYFGLAIEHLNQAYFKFTDVSEVGPDAAAINADGSYGAGRKTANVTATFGKAFVLSQNLVLKSSVLLRVEESAGSIDLSSGLLIKQKIFFGASFRQNALVIMTELNLTKNLRMGLGYDLDFSGVGRESSGSFEVFVGYDVGLFKSKVVSPRYF